MLIDQIERRIIPFRGLFGEESCSSKFSLSTRGILTEASWTYRMYLQEPSRSFFWSKNEIHPTSDAWNVAVSQMRASTRSHAR